MKNIVNAILRKINGMRRPSKKTNTRLLHKRGETLEDFTFREATVGDITALAALQVKTWADTYPAAKKPPTFETREWQWKEQFKVKDGSWFCYVVVNGKNELVGFAKAKTYDHSDLPGFSGELNKIYLLREYQRLGLGRRLIGYVARHFLSMNIDNMVLFGEPSNPSGAFHSALGAERLYANNGEFHGGYAWKDLTHLVIG